MIYAIVTLAAAGAILGTLWMMAVKNNIEELRKRVLSLEKPFTIPTPCGHHKDACYCKYKINIPVKKTEQRDEFWSKGYQEYLYGGDLNKAKKVLHSFTFDGKEHKVLQPGEKKLDFPSAMKWAKRNIEDFIYQLLQ